jgi:hypothetical protein
MAVFGQGINPALGRIDYSPYAQGAAMGAQGIAQGIAALGQGAAQGVQNYLKRKEEKQQEEAAISSIGGILKRNPELASQLNLQADAAGNFDQGALKAAIKGAGGPANTLKLASTLEELGVQRQARQQQADAARYAQMFDNQGQMFSPLRSDAGAQFSPEARAMGQQMVTQRAQALANLERTRAQTLKDLAPAAADLTAAQRDTEAIIRSEIQSGTLSPTDANAIARRRSELILKFSGPATTTIKTGDDVSEKLVAERLFADRDMAMAAQRALPAYDEAEKILKSNKAYTGTFAEAKLGIAKALAPFGINQDTAENTEVLRAQLAIPVFSLVKQLGSGAGISNADREYAEKAAGGKITLNPQAILRLTEIGRRASNLAITNYKKRLDRVYPEGEEGSSRLRRSLVLEDMAPAEAEVATPAPMEQPAPQAAQAPKFKLGDRVRQGGVTYEWNGTTMVPIR